MHERHAAASLESLQADAEMYRSLIAALDEGVVYQHADRTVLAINASAERILGLTAEQLSGRRPIDPGWHVIRENGAPFPEEEYPKNRTLRTGEPCRDVVMGVWRPDGSLIWISVNSQPLIGPDSAWPYAVVTTFADVTARKQTENEREQFLLSLERAHVRRGLLLRAVLDLAGKASPEDVLLRVSDAAAQLVQAEHGSVTRWDDEHQLLINVATTIPGIPPRFSVPLGVGATGRAAQRRQPVILNDYQQEAEITHPARMAGISAAVAVPLLHDGRLFGTLGVYTTFPEKRFAADDAEDLQLLAAIAAAVLVGMERAQLQAIAATARELAHLVNNDLALAVGALDLMQSTGSVSADLAPLVDDALRQLTMASTRLAQLGRITRFRTRESPEGPSLDLRASIGG